MLWRDKYKIGVSVIDEQHEKLFSYVNDFLGILRSDESWDHKVNKVQETLLFMKDYVITHFSDEEAYQEEIGYSGLDEHRKIHKNLVAYVVAISEQFEKEGFQEEKVQQFGGKLLAWLLNHVLSDDQKIAEYARRKEGV